jgi:hypothetical protein
VVAAVATTASLLGVLLALTDVKAASGWVLLVMFIAFLASATVLVGIGLALVRSADTLTTPPADSMPAQAAEDPPERPLVAGTGARMSGPGRLEDDRWFGLVEDAVDLVDELDRGRDRWGREQQVLADHVVFRIAEILQRSEVEIISGDEPYDRNRHAAVGSVSGRAAGAVITETVSPGFAVGHRVLRRARVRLED